MRSLCFAVICAQFYAAPALAKCHYDFMRFYYDGATSSSAGTADAGKVCSFRISGHITSIEVHQQARHGAVSWSGSLNDDTVTYKSSPSFKGSDEFTIAVHGFRKGFEGISFQTITMDVQ
jgi:hypothetical protein